LTPAGYAHRVQEIENQLDDWLDGLPQTRSPELNRLDNHLRSHRGDWLVFLHDPEVPPTNNHAEQMLRPAVITRKVGGCNKTLWGALVHGVLASIMVTCKRQGKRLPSGRNFPDSPLITNWLLTFLLGPVTYLLNISKSED